MLRVKGLTKNDEFENSGKWSKYLLWELEMD